MNKQMKLATASIILCKLIEIAIPISETAAKIEKRTKIHFIFAILVPPKKLIALANVQYAILIEFYLSIQ